MRETPVARTMLRWELRSSSSFSTCAYWAALLRVLGRFTRGGGREDGLMAAGSAQIFGLALTVAVFAEGRAATFAAT